MNRYLIENKLSDLVKVDDRFQNSINIQLDLNKKDKVLSYIPTKSSTKILNRYLKNVCKDSKEKATLLIGPYGKGKSHLLLVLLSILSMGYDEEESAIVGEIRKRIGKVDEKSSELIDEIRNCKKKYLPVIISNTQMDLNQAFLLGLNEALKRNGLGNIQPDTYFTEAIKVIEKWKNEYPDTYKIFEEKLKEQKTSINRLVRELRQCEKKSLDIFREIYPKLTSGSVFNPLINTDVFVLYNNINELLCKEHGFAGIFIIFDEFSKYIEGHEADTIASDMKILQEMCELANNSKDNQMHILLVAHKSIKEYNNALPKEVINAFTGVEGRLKEILFITSSQNNYELIQNAIIKLDKYSELLAHGEVLGENIEHAYLLPVFKTLFTEEDFRNIVMYGCFPLTPVAAYLLLGISERVAQNERTLFTFISKDEPYSMARFIREHKRGEDCFIAADDIYDYFQNIFKTDIANTFIHSEWLKADYAIKQTKVEEEIRIIKTLAILNIMNKRDEIPPTKKFLQIASGLMESEVQSHLAELKSKNIVDYRPSTEFYYFKNSVGVELEREIKREVNKLSEKINYVEVLTKINPLSYVLPKVHNQDKCIKRFLESRYYLYEDFLELTSSDVLFRNKFSDGKILYLISNKEIDIKKCEEQVEKLNDRRLIIVTGNQKFSKESKLNEYIAIQELKKNQKFISENKVVLEELQLYEEEIRYEISSLIKCMFDFENRKTAIIQSKDMHAGKDINSERAFNRFVSNVCDDIYKDTPIINNEMINKNNISTQIKAARSSLLEKIITKDDVSSLYKGTSPEASIFRASLIYTGIASDEYQIQRGMELVLEEIRTFILGAEGRKSSFASLYKTVTSAPYGMRLGALPILIAYTIRRFDDTPVIYCGNKEVSLTAEILTNVNTSPEDYFLYIEKGTVDKIEYLDNLAQLFEKHSKIQDSKLSKMNQVVLCMQRWMQSLSNAAGNFSYNEHLLSISEKQYSGLVNLRKILKKVECNPREFLFDKVPWFFDANTFMECYKNIRMVKICSDEYIVKLKKRVIELTRSVFDKNSKENVSTILKEWYSHQSESAKNVLVSTKISQFMTLLSHLDTFDEEDIVDRIAKIILDMHIENWNEQSMSEYLVELEQLKRDIEMTVDNSNNTEKNKIVFSTSKGDVVRFYEECTDDSTSYFLKNELNNVLEEFGDTLEVNQKVSILVQLINELI